MGTSKNKDGSNEGQSLSNKPGTGEGLSDRNGVSKKHTKKGKKRVRGFKNKFRQVVPIGEQPDTKRLRNGRFRKLDILRPDSDDALPRKTKQLLASMGKPWPKAALPEPSASTSKDGTVKEGVEPKHNGKNLSPHTKSNDAHTGIQSQGTIEKSSMGRRLPKEKNVAQGIQDGETLGELSHRVRKETRKLYLESVRKNSHQWEKKKAHYEKRRKRLELRKKRRRGQALDEGSDDGNAEQDDDDDADGDTSQNISALPMYWQEIVRNNGRPVSEKKRRRLHRMEMQQLKQDSLSDDVDEVKFGEQAERPPELTTVFKRGKGTHSSK